MSNEARAQMNKKIGVQKKVFLFWPRGSKLQQRVETLVEKQS